MLKLKSVVVAVIMSKVNDSSIPAILAYIKLALTEKGFIPEMDLNLESFVNVSKLSKKLQEQIKKELNLKELQEQMKEEINLKESRRK